MACGYPGLRVHLCRSAPDPARVQPGDVEWIRLHGIDLPQAGCGQPEKRPEKGFSLGFTAKGLPVSREGLRTGGHCLAFPVQAYFAFCYGNFLGRM